MSISRFKSIVEQINKKVADLNFSDWFKARYVESDETEIVILEDLDANYYETIVIYEDKAHFFGENYPDTIPADEFYNNLKELTI